MLADVRQAIVGFDDLAEPGSMVPSRQQAKRPLLEPREQLLRIIFLRRLDVVAAEDCVLVILA